MNGSRESYHTVLDQILDNFTDIDLKEGIIDIIVQQFEVDTVSNMYKKLTVQALCCPMDNGSIALDEMSKTITQDSLEGGEAETMEFPVRVSRAIDESSL